MRRIIIGIQFHAIRIITAAMQSKHASLNALLLVIGIHASLLAAMVLAPAAPKPDIIVQPTIQGVLIAAPQEAPPPPEPPPPLPPEPKPEPKPTPKPPPKAPPSERAVKAPEPPPPQPVEQPIQPAKEAEPTPAPVLPPNADASQLNNPAPAYPNLSRRLGEKGTVVLEILVKANGTVGEVKMKSSSGYKRLDDAAINAIKKWKFIPASQAGIAIDYWYEIPFEFGFRQR
ncbi:energy transducer TonB [Cellvibrio mixtus]|uniref:energy transducer TonB n=1 Tax=Cellvibrio mixtus TaxID=39650 RepID=UPI001F2F3304|nr:energy transducer TonB [Cellvibrio mixtus]